MVDSPLVCGELSASYATLNDGLVYLGGARGDHSPTIVTDAIAEAFALSRTMIPPEPPSGGHCKQATAGHWG